MSNQGTLKEFPNVELVTVVKRLRPDITAMEMPVSRSRTLSEFEFRLAILSQGVALGWNSRTPSALFRRFR